MSTSIYSVTVDCRNGGELASFWAQVLGRDVDPESNEFFASIGRANPDGKPVMMFIQVPEEKRTKNRVHLDLETEDRQGEVERLVLLGATLHSDHDEWGTRWTTLLDPEGNEFCIASHT
jgi:uncharacterized glyoxalase superfamily protein PhnB